MSYVSTVFTSLPPSAPLLLKLMSPLIPFRINGLFLYNYCYTHTHTPGQPIEIIYCCLYEHMFRADQLVLDNLSGSSSLKKTDSPSLGSHYLPEDLHLEVWPYENVPIHTGMLTDVIM